MLPADIILITSVPRKETDLHQRTQCWPVSRVPIAEQPRLQVSSESCFPFHVLNRASHEMTSFVTIQPTLTFSVFCQHHDLLCETGMRLTPPVCCKLPQGGTLTSMMHGSE
jgi:hypothetical protein